LELHHQAPHNAVVYFFPNAYGRVQKFELQARQDGPWTTFYHGTRLGEDFQASFPPVTAQHVRLDLLETTEGPSIWEFQLLAPGE
jgi:hypothetical protein